MQLAACLLAHLTFSHQRKWLNLNRITWHNIQGALVTARCLLASLTYSTTLKMEVVLSSKTCVKLYSHIPQDSTVHGRWHEDTDIYTSMKTG
jgi:hypothetical protein